ncbi:hypothetical protein ACIQZB_22475 [Streptomyces sp. NPDC097727]|uniref:hypothetical protein n=1 Tax=Streptomyces sp. NPDC097727 TaxID=3366092 RepID=UPI0038219953
MNARSAVRRRSFGGSGAVFAGLVAADDDTDTGQVAALDPSGEGRGPFDEEAGDGRFGVAIAAARLGRTIALINNRPSPRNRLPVPRDPWTYLEVRDAARAALLALDVPGPGAHAVHLCAPRPSCRLRRKSPRAAVTPPPGSCAPCPVVPRRWAPRAARRLLGSTTEHLLDD